MSQRHFRQSDGSSAALPRPGPDAPGCRDLAQATAPASGGPFRRTRRTRLYAAAAMVNACRIFHRPTNRVRAKPATVFIHPKISSTRLRIH